MKSGRTYRHFASVSAPKSRVGFYHTGFLDRTGDEIPTPRWRQGQWCPKGEMKRTRRVIQVL